MRHLLTLRPHAAGFEAFDPNVPWLRPSIGRTAEEAIADFERRLRFVEVEKRQARGWWQAKASALRLGLALGWELLRAAGLWLAAGGERRVARIGLVLLVGLPLAVCAAALMGVF
jgi:hypothetical protein